MSTIETIEIIDNINEATVDHNNMRSWNGFFFDKKGGTLNK